ncbi:Spliceosome-associated protein CWC15 homolog [Linum grandiflorum]
MTSAARPTWAPAKGASVSHNKFSSTLKPTLKPRRSNIQLEKQNLREELEQGETRRHSSSKAGVDSLIYSDHDDNEDDEADLLAELEGIKKEKAELNNNNNNNPRSLSTLKRRWDDDVVFKNQARAETKSPKRFINDTIRNDFRRRFLQTYMK